MPEETWKKPGSINVFYPNMRDEEYTSDPADRMFPDEVSESRSIDLYTKLPEDFKYTFTRELWYRITSSGSYFNSIVSKNTKDRIPRELFSKAGTINIHIEDSIRDMVDKSDYMSQSGSIEVTGIDINIAKHIDNALCRGIFLVEKIDLNNNSMVIFDIDVKNESKFTYLKTFAPPNSESDTRWSNSPSKVTNKFCCIYEISRVKLFTMGEE